MTQLNKWSRYREFCFAIPILLFCWMLPYMAKAWRYSPQDKWDWIFVLAFAGLTIWEYPQLRKQGVFYPGKGAITALVLSLGGFAVAQLLKINAAAIICSIWSIWATVYVLQSYRVAFRMLPLFLLFSLACTSGSYWLGFFFGVPLWGAWLLKGVLGCGLVVLYYWLKQHPERQLPAESLAFLTLLLFAVALLLSQRNFVLVNQPFLLNLQNLKQGEYLGSNLPLNPATERFFRASRAQQYYFAGDKNTYGVLAVECGQNIHEVHPASHCLRTTGMTIESETVKEYRIGNRRFPVSEIVGIGDNGPVLVWVWYSNDRQSTGSFLGFRRAWRSNSHWHHYQISTPLLQGVPAGRQALLALVNELRAETNNPAK